VITCSETLKDLVHFTKFSARLMNADNSLEAFDICDLMKVFDIKSSEDPSKVLYYYFLKYHFKDAEFFRDDEISLFRVTLRESIEQVK